MNVTYLSSEQDAHSVSPTPFLSEPDARKVPRVNTGYEVMALLYLEQIQDTACVFPECSVAPCLCFC